MKFTYMLLMLAFVGFSGSKSRTQKSPMIHEAIRCEVQVSMNRAFKADSIILTIGPNHPEGALTLISNSGVVDVPLKRGSYCEILD